MHDPAGNFFRGLVVRKGNCIQENLIHLNGMHFKCFPFMRKKDVTSLTSEFVFSSILLDR